MTDSDSLHEEAPAYQTGGKPVPLTEYLRKLERALRRGNATEHTHRPALKELLEALDDRIVATNEPKRSACGAPDYEISRRRDGLKLGHVEAKDVGVDLHESERSEQLKRYLPSLPNLLLTDYLEFRWFVDGKRRESFRLAIVGSGGTLVPASAEELERARHLLIHFLAQQPVDITSAEELARRLANITHNVRDIIIGAFQTGAASQQLRDWRDAFAHTLLPELAPHADEKIEAVAVREFADMFAQTLAYGLFSARASQRDVKFTREKAQKLIPRTNPFLRTFFEQITGTALDDEPFAGFVEDLIQTLAYADIARVMEDFGKRNRRRDPVVHFYETFLQAYDPKLRELRGVYYTPEPVVNYIVQSIDHLLKDKFGIKAGLADHSKVTVTRKEGEREITDEMHRVLILDPATGTATFLYAVLDFIRSQFKTKKNAGQWGSYVHEHLLPRLFGFELLMAPYAVAHFKIGLALAAMDEEPLFRQQWSYEPQGNERVNIFLTNTLEDLEHTASQLGPLRALSDEANSAFEVKRRRPVLVVLGNPPYSNFGQQNKNPWILNLLEDYKRGLNERKLNLNDDFIKFVRWAQWRIEQTGSGIIGYITNNVYLDGLTHRRMRECLLETFDEIYIVNLHGSAKKQETTPDGGKDDNVFDITVGVAIALFVKLPGAKKAKGLATVRHADLWGERQSKYDWLDAHHVEDTRWKRLSPESPDFYFVPKDFSARKEYNRGWSLPDMFPVANNGLKTDRDDLFFDFDRRALEKRMHVFFGEELHYQFRKDYDVNDSSSYDIETRRRNLTFKAQAIHQCLYRPFDLRWLYYDVGLTSRPAERVMKHFLAGSNLGFVTTRQTKECFGVVAAATLSGHKSCAAYDINTVFPIYLYPTGNLPEEDLFAHDNGRRPNLSAGFIRDFCETLQVKFVPDGLGRPGKREVGPELIFHYAYAVFHSPAYRERYAEFLRADFPRLPLTSNYELFCSLAESGLRLVNLHARNEGEGQGAAFPVAGDNEVNAVRYQPPTGKEKGRVWINDRQYFEDVPQAVWDFPIGGYLPAQRWLKDRWVRKKSKPKRKLSFEDITAYARIIYALGETRKLMTKIDEAIARHGGWPLK